MWYYSGLLAAVADTDSEVTKDLKEVDPEDITVETLENGLEQVHYDWITFQYPKSKKYVKVIATPNNTGKARVVHFMTSSKIGFSDITVFQYGPKNQ